MYYALSQSTEFSSREQNLNDFVFIYNTDLFIFVQYKCERLENLGFKFQLMYSKCP